MLEDTPDERSTDESPTAAEHQPGGSEATPTGEPGTASSPPPPRRRSTRTKAAPASESGDTTDGPAGESPDAVTGAPRATTRKRTSSTRTRKTTPAAPEPEAPGTEAQLPVPEPIGDTAPAAGSADTGGAVPEVTVTTRKRSTRKKAAAPTATSGPGASARADGSLAADEPVGADGSTTGTETPAGSPDTAGSADTRGSADTARPADTVHPGSAEPARSAETPESGDATEPSDAAAPSVAPLFQAPDAGAAPRRTRSRKQPAEETPADSETAPEAGGESAEAGDADAAVAGVTPGREHGGEATGDEDGGEGDGGSGGGRRRRRRGGRRRRKSGSGDEGGSEDTATGETSDADQADQADPSGRAEEPSQGGRPRESDTSGTGGKSGRSGKGATGNKGDKSDTGDGADTGEKSGKGGGAGQGRTGNGGPSAGESAGEDGEGSGSGSRRRRRRRRAGDGGEGGGDDPQNTVTKVRKGRSAEDEITSLSGSTRLEAKKQRRREGREAGRRRAPIVSEAEFLARRESVERVMVIREREDLTQIAVLEDKVLVEHYVARESQTSLIGNVYLGRVQNVLPSMEAAFIDIGKGRNAVLYAGEVNWSALGHQEGQPRKIESVLSSGQTVLVQVTKDPVGHKGARLTSQISLPGRFLVYVPDGTTSGISRKLPDTERNRLKSLLKEIVPDTAGVIVRTAAEGAAEDELTRDVERLKARWEDIEKGARKASSPTLLYGEPDLTLKVVRDLFTEDFVKLVVEGEDAWDTVRGYVTHVAPDLEDRLERFAPQDGLSAFSTYRIDEQIAKALDRKVWLPSGGSLVIDRTEAMTVVDVNTGKFTGSGGNLEETVTKNNLEAAEEIVRQLRLRDIGGIIVVDFIDMVLESNRDLVLRRLVECLGRDRTRHQVAEVTSLGLVQMTRKRIGTGLLEAFSEPCGECGGRGLLVHDHPVEPRQSSDDGSSRRGRRGRGGRGREGAAGGSGGGSGGGANGSGAGGTGSEAGTPTRTAAPSPKDVAAMARPENADRPPADGIADEQGVPAEVAAEVPAATAEEPAAAPAEDAGAEQAAEPSAVQAEEPVSAPAAPTVVVRTRRRASRPAGPPPMTPVDHAPAGVGTPPVSGDVEPGTVGGLEPGAEAGAGQPDGVAPVVSHVPVKKRGSRKR